MADHFRVAELVEKLSRPERLVVMLRYAERLTVVETALVLGMSSARVREIESGVVARVRGSTGFAAGRRRARK